MILTTHTKGRATRQRRRRGWARTEPPTEVENVAEAPLIVAARAYSARVATPAEADTAVSSGEEALLAPGMVGWLMERTDRSCWRPTGTEASRCHRCPRGGARCLMLSPC